VTPPRRVGELAKWRAGEVVGTLTICGIGGEDVVEGDFPLADADEGDGAVARQLEAADSDNDRYGETVESLLANGLDGGGDEARLGGDHVDETADAYDVGLRPGGIGHGTTAYHVVGDELIKVIATVRQMCPDMRFGQILATLGMLGEDMTDRNFWDIEDTELLEVVERFRQDLARRDQPAANDKLQQAGRFEVPKGREVLQPDHHFGRGYAMPIHAWGKVDANLFHDFHQTWTISIRNALNGGLLHGQLRSCASRDDLPNHLGELPGRHARDR